MQKLFLVFTLKESNKIIFKDEFYSLKQEILLHSEIYYLSSYFY